MKHLACKLHPTDSFILQWNDPCLVLIQPSACKNRPSWAFNSGLYLTCRKLGPICPLPYLSGLSPSRLKPNSNKRIDPTGSVNDPNAKSKTALWLWGFQSWLGHWTLPTLGELTHTFTHKTHRRGRVCVCVCVCVCMWGVMLLEWG